MPTNFSIILDMGVAANIVLSKRTLFALPAEIRSRLNAVFFALFLVGGALGSALGAWMFATHGWSATLWLDMAFPGIVLLLQALEYFVPVRQPPPRGPGHEHATVNRLPGKR